MENEPIGERIKRLREARHWTQEKLAGILGTSAKSVSNWENGHNHPRGSMGALREAFGPAIDGAPAGDPDPVIAAIDQSDLEDFRKDEVRHVYRRNVAAQQNEGRLSG